MLHEGNRYLYYPCSGTLECPYSPFHHGPHAVAHPGSEELLRHSDPQSPHSPIHILTVVRHCIRRRCGIPFIPSSDGIQHDRAVMHIPRYRSDRVERRRERYHSVSAHPPVRGFHPNHSAEGRGLPDGPAGVGPYGRRRLARRHGSRASAAGAARNSAWVPRIPSDVEDRRLGGRPHGKLVHVGLAHNDCPSRTQTLRHGGIVRRNEVLQHLRTARGAHPVSAHIVLQRHRYPGQRSHRAKITVPPGPGYRGIGSIGASQGLFAVDRHVRPDGRLNFVHSGEDIAGDLPRRHLASRQHALEFMHCHIAQPCTCVSAHASLPSPASMILGTRKNSPCLSGAFASASS